jgi:hypothetical protein
LYCNDYLAQKRTQHPIQTRKYPFISKPQQKGPIFGLFMA